MNKIRWIKTSDSFVISRDLLADITDWAENIYRNHFNNYDKEDILTLKENLDEIQSVLLKHLKGEVKHKKLKIM